MRVGACGLVWPCVVDVADDAALALRGELSVSSMLLTMRLSRYGESSLLN